MVQANHMAKKCELVQPAMKQKQKRVCLANRHFGHSRRGVSDYLISKDYFLEGLRVITQIKTYVDKCIDAAIQQNQDKIEDIINRNESQEVPLLSTDEEIQELDQILDEY
jgi:hypothetical protein